MGNNNNGLHFSFEDAEKELNDCLMREEEDMGENLLSDLDDEVEYMENPEIIEEKVMGNNNSLFGSLGDNIEEYTNIIPTSELIPEKSVNYSEGIISLNDHRKISPIGRISTGFEELDWLYGSSPGPKCPKWGMPVGMISAWAGEGGVGKSRTAISICKSLILEGKKVLYFQNEVDLNSFRGWILNNKSDKNLPLQRFLISDRMSLEGQLSAIEECEPDVVVVDSINRINEFCSGTGRDIKLIIDGNKEQRGYRSVLKGKNTHVIFIGHLNKEGVLKGSTDLSHLVDVVVYLENADNNKFTIKVTKNRYGRTDKESLWEKVSDGVDCLSHNRYEEVFRIMKEKGVYDEISKQIEEQEFTRMSEERKNKFRGFAERVKIPLSRRKVLYDIIGIPWVKGRYKGEWSERPWTKRGRRKLLEEWEIENKKLFKEFELDWETRDKSIFLDIEVDIALSDKDGEKILELFGSEEGVREYFSQD